MLRAIRRNLCYGYVSKEEKDIYEGFLRPLRRGLIRAEEAEKNGTLAKVENYSVMCEKAAHKRRTKAFKETPWRVPQLSPGSIPPVPASPTPAHGRKKSKRSRTGGAV